MASRLRTPTLGLAGLSMCLCLAIVGTAGRSLHVYYQERSTNMWLLPVWPNHFDVRELQMLIGTAGAIVVCNALLSVSLVVKALPANGLVVGSALLSTIISILSVVFTTILNWRAPHKDTLKTWTCRWTYVPKHLNSLGPPDMFNGLCQKTRFAYYTTIPVFVLQVFLLVLGIWALFSRRPQRSGHENLEKASDLQGHPLRNVSSARQNVSFDTKPESVRSYPDSARMFAQGGKQ